MGGEIIMSNTLNNTQENGVYISPTECFMNNCGMRDNETSNPWKCYNFHCLSRCSEKPYTPYEPTIFNSTKG